MRLIKPVFILCTRISFLRFFVCLEKAFKTSFLRFGNTNQPRKSKFPDKIIIMFFIWVVYHHCVYWCTVYGTSQWKMTKTQNIHEYFNSYLKIYNKPLREAVLKCRDLGLPRLRCESDCAQLIKALTSDQSFSELYGIVEDIKSVSFSFDFISFAWISREFNREADELAKKKLSSELVLMATTNFG